MLIMHKGIGIDKTSTWASFECYDTLKESNRHFLTIFVYMVKDAGNEIIVDPWAKTTFDEATIVSIPSAGTGFSYVCSNN